MSTKDILNPPPQVLVKLGSLAIHIEEFLSPAGHEYDRVAIKSLLEDQQVREWLDGMDALAFLPKKRDESRLSKEH